MKKTSLWIQTLLFVLFISVFFLLNLLVPDNEFSQQENRYLAKVPRFSLSSVASGKWMSEFETYSLDQFVFRDTWTSLKAATELMMGKHENNGIYLCDNDTLLERFEVNSTSQLYENTDFVSTFAAEMNVPVYFALIPGPVEILKDMLPMNAPGDRQLDLIAKSYEVVKNVTRVDAYHTLNAHKDEYIYYRTDHHWTSLGAYYGYTSILEAMGKTPTPLSAFQRNTVSKNFYGTVYSSSGFSWVTPDQIETFVSPPKSINVTNFPKGAPVSGTLYDESFLEKKDQYAMFMGGNTPLVHIETGNAALGSILIFRDSYLDSMVPFLLPHFSDIYMVDLRYNQSDIASYISEISPDEVLICYSLANFATDTNLYLLTD